jgi:hypothetical protein
MLKACPKRLQEKSRRKGTARSKANYIHGTYVTFHTRNFIRKDQFIIEINSGQITDTETIKELFHAIKRLSCGAFMLQMEVKLQMFGIRLLFAYD